MPTCHTRITVGRARLVYNLTRILHGDYETIDQGPSRAPEGRSPGTRLAARNEVLDRRDQRGCSATAGETISTDPCGGCLRLPEVQGASEDYSGNEPRSST